MLTFVLLAQLAAIQLAPNPVLVKEPVEHWSCPAGFYVEKAERSCVKVSPMYVRLFGLNPAEQEFASWGWVKVVPASGVLRVEYAAGLVRPGCEVIDKTDEATNWVRFSEENKTGFTIHGKPGHKLHLNCHAIMQRPVERSTN